MVISQCDQPVFRGDGASLADIVVEVRDYELSL
jgi:hypothetical protein